MADAKKVILVTGGSGLVGQGIRLALEEHSLKQPNEEWIFASSKDLNLCSADETNAFFERVNPTHVIHLAAKVGGLFANMSDNLGFFTNEPLLVLGSGSPLRQFIYSVDLGRLIIWVLRNYDNPEPIILSVPEANEISIKDAASAIVSAMGCKGLTLDPSKADGQFKKTASAKKLTSLNPDFNFTPFQKAIADTCDWFSKNFDTSRK
ncbi:unnamed protein product [Rodentolepis nana]|uniref:Epimerase domain-containing protein n=1 Tax=Rodentolepis nana TaxID=102285 RepID=A0A0R3TPM4_RODNA|nr:unnamed protein product [Rodentolepis nana]